MRAKLLLVGGLVLLLGCSGGGAPHAPPPPHKQLLDGKWKNNAEGAFIAGYEFTDDGSVKMTLVGREQPLAGRYTWSGERTLDLVYPDADVRQAYQAAAKAYKEQLHQRVKDKKLPDRAEASMMAAIPDELPERETVRVGISEQPRLLILNRDNGGTQTFEKAE
jgi:hypothetical protein